MAITVLSNQETKKPKSKANKATRQKEKPNIREFVKECPDSFGVGYPVLKGRVTESGWLIIETTDWIGFIHAGSSVAENLIDEILPGLNGTRANGLVAIPNKGNKYGFVLGVDDELLKWYVFDADEESFTLSEHQDKSEGKQQPLTLNMFTATKSPLDTSGKQVLTTDKKNSSQSKAQRQEAIDRTTGMVGYGKLPED